MSELAIHLFGFPEFLIDGHLIHLKRRKTIALLAYLSVETFRIGSSPAGIGRETLAALFWPDCSQDQAGAYLRQSLWEFSSLAGENWILRFGGELSLNFPAGITVDTNLCETIFRQWKNAGGQTDLPEIQVEEVIRLVCGNFLAGFNLKDSPSFDHWQTIQNETLRGQIAQLLEASTNSMMTRSDFHLAEVCAAKWLALDPLNEKAHRALMDIFNQTGQKEAALRQFEVCRSILKKELDVEPEPQTLALYKLVRKRLEIEPANPSNSLALHSGGVSFQKPIGTVTFVFTDIEGSTHLWEHKKEAMKHAFHRQEEIVRSAMAAHDGYVYKMIGDAFQVAFATASKALQAAVEAQRNLHKENWDSSIGEIKVRMALHTGVTEERDNDYVGPSLNRVARLLSAGHGGQVLLSEAVYQLVRDDLPSETALQYLGEYRLKDLIQPERVYQLSSPGLLAKFPPLKAESTRLVLLPVQTHPFIGREVELAHIARLLNDLGCHLVTLLGIGGSGKTRLAVQAAEEAQGFKDGVIFCSLENVESVLGLILAISEAVNLILYFYAGKTIDAEGARAQLFQYLADKQLLLVLDNFEQLVFCADLIWKLLDSAPDVKIMITSRQRLNLPGEWVLEVGGLAYPDIATIEPLEAFSGVQLFISTAERSGSFHPSQEDWLAIQRICQLLEGIPLGLEMAASWTRTLSCIEICDEIERNQDFLVTSWRGMPERHQTLRSVFEHSWRLLSENEQAVFSRLSIFVGGFNREAALMTADASLSLIGAFVDKALVRRISSGQFEIHPLLRRYAAEKLSADQIKYSDARSRMANYYTDWLSNVNNTLRGSGQLAGLAAIRMEIANLHETLECLVSNVDVERLSRVLPVWILYHVMNDRKLEMLESSRMIVGLVDRLRPQITTLNSLEAGLLALACATVRFFCNDVWEQPLVEPYLRESVNLIKDIPDNQNKAYALLLNGIGYSSLDSTETIALAKQSARLFDQLGDPWGSGMALLAVGDANTFAILVPDDARSAYTRGLLEFTRLGGEWGRALCLAGLMYLESRVGNFQESLKYGHACMLILGEMGSFERMAQIRHNLADTSEKMGCIPEAIGYYQDNLEHFTRRGDKAAQHFYQNKLAELTTRKSA